MRAFSHRKLKMGCFLGDVFYSLLFTGMHVDRIGRGLPANLPVRNKEKYLKSTLEIFSRYQL